jgi:hypothetical protein
MQIVGTDIKYRVNTKDSAGTVGVVDGIELQYPLLKNARAT